MPQDFDLKLKGVPDSVLVMSAKFVQTFDTVNDGFSATIQVNRQAQPELYEAIKPYQATPAQVYLDGQLKLTGKLTKTGPGKTPNETIYHLMGASNTFNFADSKLKPPYEYTDKTIHSLCILAGRQTATKVLHTGPNLDPIKKAVAVPGMTAINLCAPWANKRNHVISSTPDGILLLQQADITQKPVGVIEENGENSLLQKTFRADFDLRHRFRTYKVLSRRPDGAGEATATDKNITDPRHQLIFANDVLQGDLLAHAEYKLKLNITAALTQQIPVVGWTAPDGKLWRPGSLITLVSETLFVPNGFTYFIRAVEFDLTGSTKTAILSLIPKEIYSEAPVLEPWFEESGAAYLEYQATRI